MITIRIFLYECVFLDSQNDTYIYYVFIYILRIEIPPICRKKHDSLKFMMVHMGSLSRILDCRLIKSQHQAP
jgi:hypothetical protein